MAGRVLTISGSMVTLAKGLDRIALDLKEAKKIEVSTSSAGLTLKVWWAKEQCRVTENQDRLFWGLDSAARTHLVGYDANWMVEMGQPAFSHRSKVLFEMGPT